MKKFYNTGSLKDYGKRSENFTKGYSFFDDDRTVKVYIKKPVTSNLIIEYQVDDNVYVYKNKAGFQFPKGVVYQVLFISPSRLVLSVSKGSLQKKKISEKTFNEKLFDALVRHKINLLRYAGGVSEKAFEELSKSNDDLRGMIIGGLSDNPTLKQIDRLVERVKKERLRLWDISANLIVKEVLALGKQESSFLKNTLLSLLPVAFAISTIPNKSIEGLLIRGKWDGRTLQEWLNHLSGEDIRKIESLIRSGASLGENPSVVAKTLFGKDGILKTTARNIETLVKSAVSYVTGNARNETFVENAKLFEYERYTAVLDNRTTPLCRSLDGNVYKIGEGAIPPMHPNCRSVRIPILNRDNILKMELTNIAKNIYLKQYTKENNLDDVAVRDQLPRGHKESFDEYVRKKIYEDVGNPPSVPSYNEWLLTQPKEFVEGILGIQRAKIFLNGEITLDKYVSFTGNLYTLDELNK